MNSHEKELMFNQIEADNNSKAQTSSKYVESGSRVKKLTKEFDNFSLKETFSGYSMNIAMYAITLMSREPDIICGCDITSSLASQPEITTLSTDEKEITNVYRNALLTFVTGSIFCYFNPDMGKYFVEIAARNEKDLQELHSRFEKKLEKSNFYRKKCMRFVRDGVVFIKRPSTDLDDVIVDSVKKDIFLTNTLEFMENKAWHEITKKRGVVLWGPPGTGKTSLVSALFNKLDNSEVSCIFVAGNSFDRITLTDFVDFVVRFLSPAVVVMEDFDLIGGERRYGAEVLGELLTILDGIEKFSEPIVIIGSTNRLDSLDSATIRPRRFDRLINIDYPSHELIAQLWSKMGGIGDCPKDLVHRDKLTGAHIKEILDTASMRALKFNEPVENFYKESIIEVLESFSGAGEYQPKKGFGFSSSDEVRPTMDNTPGLRNVSERPEIRRS